MDEPKPYGWTLVDREDGTWALISSSKFFVAGFRSDRDAMSWLLGFLDNAADRDARAKERVELLNRQLALSREEMLARLLEPAPGAKPN